MTPLNAIEIVRSEYMANMKNAVRMNGIVYVSPAMYELISKEEGAALERLLANLPIIEMGEFNPLALNGWDIG